MRIIKHSVDKDREHCNFCNRGELSTTGFGLVYPYNTVYSIQRNEGGALLAFICEECLLELAPVIEIIKTSKP